MILSGSGPVLLGNPIFLRFTGGGGGGGGSGPPVSSTSGSAHDVGHTGVPLG